MGIESGILSSVSFWVASISSFSFCNIFSPNFSSSSSVSFFMIFVICAWKFWISSMWGTFISGKKSLSSSKSSFWIFVLPEIFSSRIAFSFKNFVLFLFKIVICFSIFAAWAALWELTVSVWILFDSIISESSSSNVFRLFFASFSWGEFFILPIFTILRFSIAENSFFSAWIAEVFSSDVFSFPYCSNNFMRFNRIEDFPPYNFQPQQYFLLRLSVIQKFV